MNKKLLQGTAGLFVATMLLSACGGGSGDGSNTSSGATLDPNVKVTITVGGFNMASDPGFPTLNKAFNKKYPNVTVKAKEYSAANFDKQMTADISAGTAPDVFPTKNLDQYATYVKSGVLADLSDIAKSFNESQYIKDSLDYFKVKGKTYAIPNRSDPWVLFYNKDMFKKAGIAEPTSAWTWDDYLNVAEKLKSKLSAAGYADAKPLYHHSTWPNLIQGPSFAQDGSNQAFFSGKYDWMTRMYGIFLKAQKEGLTIDYNTVSSTNTAYQSQFGTQKAAIMPMGAWYASTLISQQGNGQANRFDWGMAPLPQKDTSTLSKPVTFGGPTADCIPSNIKGNELLAAKAYVAFAAGEEGSKVMAAIGSGPAYKSPAVTVSFFGQHGAPQDALSKEAWSGQIIKVDIPVGEATPTIKSELNIAHSSIMSKTQSVSQALTKAADSIKNDGVLSQ